MLRQTCIEMLKEKDIIFEIFGYATRRRKEVGAEKVYDFSLGNPSVPAPQEVEEAILRITRETDPLSLHSYSPAGGIPEVRVRIAEDLNRRFGTGYEGRHLFMTCGAAAALAHALRAVTNPGDEVLTFAPFFSEYAPYIHGAGCEMKAVPADQKEFRLNLPETERLLTEGVSAVLLNSPSNPSGAVFGSEDLTKLAELLHRKAAEYGHPIFLISDEPYRDIVFAGTECPYIASFYPDTLTCYSYSKSLSLPGERIGYVAVNPASSYADRILELLPQVSRLTGHNGAAALWQRVAAETCGITSDLSVYETNRNLLVEALSDFGYEFTPPGGTFYLFPRSPLPDAGEFCRKAMEKDLMLVPGDGFGCPGFFRIAFCVPTERVEKSLPVFRELAALKER